jgi:hypothetical protein
MPRKASVESDDTIAYQGLPNVLNLLVFVRLEVKGM